MSQAWRVESGSRNLYYAAFFAASLELGLIALTGVKFHFRQSEPSVSPVTLESEVVVIPEEHPKLRSQTALPPVPEEALSNSSQVKPNASPSKSLDAPNTNQIQHGKPLAGSHGPVLIESPAPVIPDYLKDKEINAKVIIEFTVLKDGRVSPRLLVSSGNEELDQIAIGAASRWKFYPAESEHQAIDAKVKLRIVFEVK